MKTFERLVLKYILRIIYYVSYIIPVKKWSGNDYKNVVTKEELEKLVNGK